MLHTLSSHWPWPFRFQAGAPFAGSVEPPGLQASTRVAWRLPVLHSGSSSPKCLPGLLYRVPDLCAPESRSAWAVHLDADL